MKGWAFISETYGRWAGSGKLTGKQHYIVDAIVPDWSDHTLLGGYGRGIMLCTGKSHRLVSSLTKSPYRQEDACLRCLRKLKGGSEATPEIAVKPSNLPGNKDIIRKRKSRRQRADTLAPGPVMGAVPWREYQHKERRHHDRATTI